MLDGQEGRGAIPDFPGGDSDTLEREKVRGFGSNIVIFGFPRSGSTMFYNMLRSTVRGYRFLEEERSAVHALKENSWPLITKFPSDCFYVNEIRTIDPKVTFLAMIRDPRDVLCSKHYTTGNRYKVSADHTIFGKPSPNRLGKQNQPGRFRSHWGLIDWYEAILRTPCPHILYEVLVLSPQQIQLLLHKYVGLNFSGFIGDFHHHEIPDRLAYQLNGIRPLDRTRIGVWRDHPERIKDQFSRFPALFDIVIELGYEKDKEWIKTL